MSGQSAVTPAAISPAPRRLHDAEYEAEMAEERSDDEE
jgi:hypothetical protein